MKILGIHYTMRKNGTVLTTLHVVGEFESFYTDFESNRSCVGKKVETIYVGEYDCSNLQVGMEIDISYDKAVTTSKGTFQSIKKIDIISK